MNFCLNMFEQCRDMMRSALGSFNLLGALAFRDKLGYVCDAKCSYGHRDVSQVTLMLLLN